MKDNRIGALQVALAAYESVVEIEKRYTWPDPDWWDYSRIADAVKGHDDLPVCGGGSGATAGFANRSR